jgi:lipopolysaccharide biosynthesis regulator YciM
MMHLWWLIPIALLPIAAASGWYLARRHHERTEEPTRVGLQPDYFRGINYLLNEQPDKAIQAFIRVLEVDSETVETHLALGNLYRRRGEVDRAIRIHQNLIARPTLSLTQRSEALLELGNDYMSAGLLDRAESLFNELGEDGEFATQALRQMVDLYEQERDWDNAIASARKLERITGDELGRVIAHYYCEKAELTRQQRNLGAAIDAVRAALASDPGCVRASLLEGDIVAAQGQAARAVAAYRRVEEQDAAFLPEVIPRLRDCYAQLGQMREMEAYLSQVMERHGGVTAMLALAELRKSESGDEAAAGFVTDRLETAPSVRGLDYLLRIAPDFAAQGLQHHPRILRGLVEKLMENRAEYKCEHCGFPAKSLHWQCPACKHWNAIKPLQGI